MFYGGMMGYYYDPTLIFVIIGALLSLVASARVNSTYNKYSKVRSMSGMTGAEAAKRLLNSQGIYDVQVRPVSGQLTDHYDPRSKTVNLSDSVYDSTSVAAIGVAAHECGHAMQDNTGYVPLKLRGAIVPVANIGSQAAFPIILLGFFIGGVGSPLVNIGLLLFSVAVLFQLVTLPVEFNASSRAIHLLGEVGILGSEELGHTRKVLGAAALTYVAALAATVLQLARLVFLFGGRRQDD
ncbi:MAG: zinc metallopeptidase [Clostridiales bacterium]|uniref:zinc metallopeptidase n=1 Tax=Lacrimispora sp. TaxID=2719234 RepID=UPI0028A6A8AC|nr:zinc metallopeptidase [Lacrimispora sp.]MBS5959306.1 zinc metallopeptidase [Clostridiales bacterium]